MKPSNTEFDAIVVGSGPGGATVARDLSLKGQKVLILEWGDNEPVKGSFWQIAKNCFIPGKGIFITSNLLGMLRGITTGGSSLHYCGTCFDPPTDMLGAYGVDISKEAAELRDEIPTSKLSDELMSPAGELFLKSATELGYDCKRLDKFIYQNKCKPNCQLCDYGCPYGAKWNARFFVDEAMENGAKLITKAKVGRVLIENRKAVGVEYKKNKELFRAYADKVVIAAGGISSPLILRKSGVRGVGYDFFCDPLMFVLGKVPGLKEGRGIPMSAGIHLEKDGIMMTDFNMPHIMKVLFDLELLKLKKAFSYKSMLPIMIKVRDDLGGRLTKRGWTAKRLTKNDKDKLNKGCEHAKKILENLGATEIYKTWLLAAHPGGTVKIGEYVDKNLKTKFDNLYVCDASVIPEELGMPPTLTILSLGRRLASHIMALDKPEVKEDSVIQITAADAQPHIKEAAAL
jgi:choline dehydrogenase-like flavoprotein